MLDHIHKIIERRSQYSGKKHKSSLHEISRFTELELEKVQTITKKVEPTTFVSSNRHVLPRENYLDSKSLKKVYSPTSSDGRMALNQALQWQI